MQARLFRGSLAVVLILAMISLVTVVGGGDAVSAQAINTFSDDDGNIHEANIEFIAAAGITTGCGPSLYCPAGNVTRGQMAAFLKRTLNLPATATDFFTDDDGNIFEDDINRLAASGITFGCTATTFCPTATVTRGQMAAFLKRGFKLGATATDFFTDDNGTTFENDINRLAASGITVGCTATTFCPTANVRRDQMASFLARALTKFPTTTTTTSSTTTSSTTTPSTTSSTTSSTTTTSTTVATNPLFTQTAFQIYDDGTEATATTLAGLNEGAVVADETVFGVRIGVTNTGTGLAVNIQPKLQYRYIGPTSPAGPGWSAWVDVTDSSARVRSTGSGSLTDDAVTTERLAGLSTFTPGRIDDVDGAITTPVAVGPGEETEFLFSVRLTGADETDQYQFQIVDATSGIDVYVLNPSVNLPFMFANGFDNVGAVDGAVVEASDNGDPDQWSQTVPVAVKEVSTVDVGTSTGGTFVLTVDGQTTAAIPFDASAADVKAALELLSTVTSVSVTGTGQVGTPWVITFDSPIQSLDVSGDGASLTGGALTITEMADGVGAAVYDDAVVKQGGFSALFARLTGEPATFLRTNDFNQAQDLYGRLYFRYTGFPAPEGTRVVDVVGGYANGDTNSHSITVQADGRVLMTSGGTIGLGRDDFVMDPVLAPNEWYRFEWHATTESVVGASDGTFEVKIYDSLGILYASGLRTNVPTLSEFEDADFGPRTQTVTAWIDEVVLSNTDWIGAVAP